MILPPQFFKIRSLIAEHELSINLVRNQENKLLYFGKPHRIEEMKKALRTPSSARKKEEKTNNKTKQNKTKHNKTNTILRKTSPY